MSREIKFRVWDGTAMYDATDHPDWTLDNFVNASRMAPEYRPDPERYKLMQFTGLKDKNGKDIYEDDIVSHEDAYGPCVIEYQPAEYVACDRQGMGYDPCANCEVIGNIHEHPELLTP